MSLPISPFSYRISVALVLYISLSIRTDPGGKCLGLSRFIWSVADRSLSTGKSGRPEHSKCLMRYRRSGRKDQQLSITPQTSQTWLQNMIRLLVSATLTMFPASLSRPPDRGCQSALVPMQLHGEVFGVSTVVWVRCLLLFTA